MEAYKLITLAYRPCAPRLIIMAVKAASPAATQRKGAVQSLTVEMDRSTSLTLPDWQARAGEPDQVDSLAIHAREPLRRVAGDYRVD